MNYVRVGGYIPPQPIEDYNDLPNIPVISQDLAASGFTPVANSYYRHTGATTASFTKGVIYLYNGTGYVALDGSAYGLATVAKTGSYNDLSDKPTIPDVSGKANVSGQAFTGGISAPNISTGTDAANYFQSQKFRGEGNADTYYHAVDFGYAGHNQVDFHEYGGLYNFHQNTVGTSDGGSLVGAFTPDGIKEGSTLLKDKYLGKSGGTITGDLTVGGNFTVSGTTTTVDSTTLKVSDKLIEVAKDNTAKLTTPAGIVVPKYDGTSYGALVIDGDGNAQVGDVKLDTSGNIDVANSDLQILATRTGLVGGNLVQYDSTALTLKDSGKKISDLALKTDISGLMPKKGGTFTGEVKFGGTENFQGYYIKRMIGSLGPGTAYNNLDSKYKDGTYHRMWRLRFPKGSSFWGKIKITLYGGYSSFNASGVMSKSITCNFNTSNIYNNVGCYDGLGVNVEQDFRISEAIWNATVSAWEVLIWQKNLSGNNSPVIMLECWTANNTNYINAFNGITAQPVELTQSTSYSAQRASSTGGTKTVEWATLPVYENPLGEEIATMSDIPNSVKSVIDYNNTNNRIKIGYSGDGLSGDSIKYIAGYTTGDSESAARIKDINKDALKSWLGYATVATSGSYNDLSNRPSIPVSNTKSDRTPSQCTANGFYYVTSSTNSLTDADGNPFLQYHASNNDFRILATAYDGSWVQQIATDFRSTHIYYRIRNNGTWGAWTEIAKISDIPDISGKLDKTKYEVNKTINFGQDGSLYVGKFKVYDTNVTCEITSTTSVTYSGKLVIATQNYVISQMTVYGDAANTVAPNFFIKPSTTSDPYIEVYFKPMSWSKNVVHIYGSNIEAEPTDVCTNEPSIPSTATLKPKNALPIYSLSGTTLTITL